MEIKNERPHILTYRTWNQSYGEDWEQGDMFAHSFTQSDPYRDLTDRRLVMTHDLPKDRYAVALAHNPESPCGIMTVSNMATSTRCNFTNVRRDLYSTEQGLWNNSVFNTPGATIDRGTSTFSNIHGAWGRIGPSSFDSIHVCGEWVPRWGIRCFEPSPLRALRDHRNVDPRDNWVPIENFPQNLPHGVPYQRRSETALPLRLQFTC